MILGTEAEPEDIDEYGRGVIAEFIRFVTEIALARRLSREAILSRIGTIEGREHFEAAERMRRGLVVATCHCGNFEVGAAAVTERASETHVLFQGDRQSGFEQMRSSLHEHLGIAEAHVETGLAAWMQLRDALTRGGAVLIQADRCMPGQDGIATPFFGSQLVMPDGPAKLARLADAPILPVACVIESDERTRLIIGPPIDPRDSDGFDHRARRSLAAFFEGVVRTYPTQWHTLHSVFVEPE